ncbi:MAG: hypothetical protein OEM15_12000 [Myxococcales bacterium]|nr:hypothetical protein [Myxococcales bacterium]MDH3484475.1 hypothetical protein [Myxococcales bacterium]
MAVSSRELGAWVSSMLAVLLLGSCATGPGEGSAVGQVWAPDCGLDGEPFSLDPNFFGMEPSRSVEIIDMRMQRGGDIQNLSDGVSFFIAEPELLKAEMLGADIELELLDSPVQMTLYLNRTCPLLSQIPVVYRSVSGTIRFDELYVPWIENDNRMTTAVFTDVELVDTAEPEIRRAVLSGDISFLVQRGMPPQNFGF